MDVTIDDATWQAAVNELSEACARAYPDPVDSFEDARVRELGLERHPSCPLPTWRAIRVQALDGVE